MFDIIDDPNTLCWKNADMGDYYENIPIELLQNYAIKGGFENGCDIDLVYPYIKHTHSIIEVGAAYGRVIGHLIRKNYSGEIYAIERSKSFCKYLRQHYQDRVNIINMDIQYFQPPQKIEAMLWMWSNITEFPKIEQLPMLKHLSSWLMPSGIFVMETILHTLKPTNVTFTQGQSYVVDSEYGKAYGYTPSTQEVHEYAEKLGFKYIKHINYKTSTKRERILHIFSNNAID